MGRQALLHYEILGSLGEGGMSVVYKARDSHLNRTVAIKILRPLSSSDPQRKRRFMQEARAASALNHPNIITVYDIDSANGTDFIVMEYVRGKSLDRLIPRHGLPIGETLRYSVQIADALSKAHAAGIIHRDLKPSNIMINEDGQVKLVDFGLAKLTERTDTGELNTLTLQRKSGPMTEDGLVVGTAAYMSPEQAEGKHIDARSDIFSFGCVLYEMLSGHRAFGGESNVSTIAAILKDKPKPIGRTLPKELERAVARCLHKDPNRRFQTAADLKVALQELKEESDTGALAPAAGAARPAPARRRAVAWAAAALGLAVLGAGAWIFRDRLAGPRPEPRLLPLTAYEGTAGGASFSPDGDRIAFHWNGPKQDNFDIYIKLIDSPTPVRLTTDPARDHDPAWSPDGRSIAFVRDLSGGSAVLMLTPSIGGGPEREIARVSEEARPAWSPDAAAIAVVDRDPPNAPPAIFLVSPPTGEKRRLTSPPPRSQGDVDPAFSPDGRTLAFARSSSVGRADLYLVSLSEALAPLREPRQLTRADSLYATPVWTADGREIVFTAGTSSFSLWRTSVSGARPPVQIETSGEAMRPAVSRRGDRLAFTRPLIDPNIWRVDLAGASPRAGPLISSSRREENPQYSPDGKRIAFGSNRSGSQEIWVSDSEGLNAVPITALGRASCGSPRWSPDGERIAFDWNAAGHWDIYTVSSHGGKVQRMTVDSGENVSPGYSRDGKWLYFASNRTGRYEIWKVPARGGNAVQVTSDGGFVAFESPDGKWLYHTTGNEFSPLWKMPIGGGRETRVLPWVYHRAFAVTGRGIWFLTPPQPDDTATLDFYNFGSGTAAPVMRVERHAGLGLSASPNGRFLLYTQWDQFGSDLFLMEGFR